MRTTGLDASIKPPANRPPPKRRSPKCALPQLSAEGFSSHSPRWSPDGKMLAFLSARSSDLAAGETPKSQIYLLSIAGGGEAIALTKLKKGVQSYQWSPEGSRVVVVSTS